MSLDTTHLTLGPFRVDTAGRLEAITSTPAPGFTCRWRDRHVYAKLLPGQPAGDLPFDWRLHVQTPLGRVPSTARPAKPGTARGQLPTAARVARHTATRLALGLAPHDQRCFSRWKRHVPLPITATTLVTEMTCSCWPSPYLDLLEDSMYPAVRASRTRRRQREYLTWIDQVRVADLIAVRLEDDSVAQPLAIGPISDAPQARAGLHDDPVRGRLAGATISRRTATPRVP